MSEKFIAMASLFLISSCASTGVVQTDSNKYMASVKNAKVGFVSPAGDRADAYNR